MALFDGIARWIGQRIQRASAGTPSYGLIPPLGSVSSASGMLISQATAMAVSTVYACVRRRAIDAARCPPGIYRPLPNGTREKVTDHPLCDLFIRPNRQQNWLEFAEQMNVALLLRGNAYAAIRRDSRGDPIELIPINPDAVMVLEAGDGSVFYNVNRIGLWQIAMLREFPVAIAEEDMFHLRGLTFNSLVSVSTIGLGRDSIGLSMALDQQANRWVANGARPSVILKSPKPLSDVAIKRLKAQWDEFSSGIQNVGRTAVLEDGVDAKALALTSSDLEFISQRNFSSLEICRFMGVPPHKVFADTGRSAYMDLNQQDQDYFNSTIAGDIDRWEHKAGQVFDLDDEGLKMGMNVTELLRADIMTRYNSHRLGILSGFLKPNEARLVEGLPPDPAGDELLAPSNTAALGSEATGTAPEGAGRPPKGQISGPTVSTGGKGPKAPKPGPTDEPTEAGHEPGMAREVVVNIDSRRSGKRRMTMQRQRDGTVLVETLEDASE